MDYEVPVPPFRAFSSKQTARLQTSPEDDNFLFPHVEGGIRGVEGKNDS